MLCPIELAVSTHAIAKSPTTEGSNDPASSFMFLSHFNLQLYFCKGFLFFLPHFPSPSLDGYIYFWPSCYLLDLFFYCFISVLSFFFYKTVFAEPYCATAAFFSASQFSTALASSLGGRPDSPFWVSILILTRAVRGKYIDFLWNRSYFHVKRRVQ